MQEDQLYALEDYLEEYQRLVCKYRSENAALKRQLNENGISPSNDMRRTNDRARPTPAGPNMDATPPTDDVTPPLEIDSPDVPPLEATTSDDSNSKKGRRHSRGQVKLASAQQADIESPTARALAFEQIDNTPVATDVWLHGEVVANETGGGPRLVVEVEPLDAEVNAI